MRKIFQIAVLAFLIAGCGSLKQGWNNFTAYYNTFYNAKKFYNSGLEKNKNQLPEINPNQPIRVHRPPTNAGLEDFEKAIEKGSGILRNHNDSKYVIPALFIIGKSYYYRSGYFAALEKFQELNTIASGENRQEAIVWLGLTYLEMSNYDQGIEVLQYELDNEMEWTPKWRAEAQVVLGELHTALENWETAAEYLQNSIVEIEGEGKKARTHFLLGQVFENIGDLNRALFSYTQINDLRTDFDLEFNATRKQAEVSRQIGSYDYAVSIYQKMRRDDKFLDYRSDLQYEIARSLQLKGDYNAAVSNYNNVLSDRAQPPSNITIAKTYYGLGEIYRDDLEDLGLAAAYFDSAASQRVDQSLLAEDFDARELATSFGEYVNIKQNIAEKDSLLNLAGMDSEELEQFIEELRQQELAKMEEELEQMQSQRDQMLVVDSTQEPVQAASTTEYGFLNIESPTRLADASLQFQAIWGDRPLADNWRRREAVSGSRFDQIVESGTDSAVQTNGELTSTGIQPTIDTSDIPFSEEAKQEMKTEIEALNYRLGNVFFLSLDMPDSAKVYYQKVIESGYNEDLVTKSMYSIAEVELLQNNTDQARQWYQKLRERNLAATYTNRLADRLGLEHEDETGQTESEPEFEYRSILENDSTLASQELVMLSDSASNESVRPYILLDAAKNYMLKAKDQPGFEEEMQQWFEEQREIESQREQFEALKDSARTMLADTSLTEQQEQYWNQIADSTFTEPDISETFPFEGALWDSTRSILQQIENQYSASKIMPQVNILQQTLAKPSQDSAMARDSLSANEVPTSRGEVEAAYQSCSDLGIHVDVDGGIESFMSSLSYPSWTEDVSIRGELEYLFTIEPDGTIQSYEQLSRMDRSGIPQAVEAGIDNTLRFTPHENEGEVRCTAVFPFNL
ncbi:MAG: hypothetical protein R3220_01165 [Balneolaceae bacterium]|nr:hypothetical protein [Balneolaceae bacterium]